MPSGGVQNSMNTQGNAQAVFNQTRSAKGPLAVPLSLDFSVEPAFLIDLSTLNNFNTLDMVQTIYADNSNNPSPLILTNGVSQQVIAWPPFSQGYLPVLCPNPGRFTLASAGGVQVDLELMNFPVSPFIWGTNAAPPFLFDEAGGLITSDETLAQVGLTTVSGKVGLNVNVIDTSAGASSSFANHSASLTGAAGSGTTTLLNPGGAAKFLLHSASFIWSPEAYCRSTVAARVKATINEEGVGEIVSCSVWLPGASVALTDVTGGLLFSFPNLDILSSAVGNRLQCTLSEDIGDATAGGLVICTSSSVIP